ncbi:MAG: ATP-binding cassette domain-containing protein, partial [Pseudomonadota bacterium]
GRDITTLPAHKRPGLGLARSFQITAIIPGFTVLENAALASQSVQGGTFSRLGRASSDTAINDNALAALSAVGLVDSAERVAGTLAHGEKRALELAMALALKPKLMLLDEPMAGTGRDETNRMIALLETVKAQATVVLVEHDMSAVFALADTISVLDQGRIIATGAPEAIRNDAAVKAAYLGEDSP